jgi:DNA repair exonuclease SbcCD ATPase subunit
MRILRLRVRNYRGVVEHEVAFAPSGVTVIHGDNEVGKSSLAESLDLLFDYRDDSTHRVVKAVRPAHRDAGAEIEADVEAGPYRFTYAKRFHRDRFTTLTVTAPRAENLTGREAHERALAILEEAVDMPLWRALRLQQGVRLDQADLSEQTSLAAALDAAAAGALAGEREATLVDLARAEYERFHTPKGSLKADVLALAKAEADAEARADDLRRKLAELEDDVEHCASLVSTIAQLSQESAEQQQRVRGYQGRWREVEGLLTHLRQAELEAQLAQHTKAAAEADVARRLELAAALADAERAEVAAREQHQLSTPALMAAAQAVANAEQRAVAADERVRTLSAELRSHQAAFTHHRDRHDYEVLAERFARVQAAQAEVAALDALLDGNHVDDNALARIEDAHLALAQSQARADAARPVVVVEALAPLSVTLPAEDVRLAAGATARTPLGPDSAIVVGDLARITVESQSQADRTVAQAEHALATALAAVGATDLAQARAAAAARRDAARSIEHLARTLADNLRDLTPERMQAKVERLAERVSQAGASTSAAITLDFETARQLVETAEQELARAEADAVVAREELDGHRSTHARLEQKADKLARDLELAAQRVEVARQSLTTERAGCSDQALHDRLLQVTDAARRAEAQLAAATDVANRARPDDLRAALDNATAVLDKLDAERAGAERTHTEVRARLALMGDEGLHDKLAEAEADLDHRRRQRTRTEEKAAAARRLYDTLLRCRAEARHAYVGPLRTKIESLGRVVFGDDFAVEVADDLRITRRTLGGVTLDFDQLSTGAREQLCVLARLACAALVAEDGGVPVILDDALGWSDARRLERLGAAFNVVGQRAQVIVLTCMPERYRHIGSATRVRLESVRY